MVRVIAAGIAGLAVGMSLGACSDLYFERRDAITLSAGDAIAANAATQIIDPWPAYSGNTHIPGDGQKMQSAVERYRTNRVIQPANSQTLDITAAQQSPQAAQSPTPNAAAAAGNAPSTGAAAAQISSQ